MKKYLLIFTLLVVALFLVSQTVSAQGANVTNLTPTADTPWAAGSSNNINWNHAVGFGTGGMCGWVVALVALRSDGVPATYLNIYGQMVANFHGQYLGQVNASQQFATTESGTISLPADALPGRYKVVARCQSITMGNYEGVSTGIVTVSNPANRSYYPLILTSPLTPLNFPAGQDASGVGINLRTAEKAGGGLDPNTGDMGWVPEETPITVKMIRKSDQSTYWEQVVNWMRVREGSEEIPYYLSTNAGFNFEDVSSIDAGTYFFRASLQLDSQTYSIDSADLIFTAPAPTPTLTVTAPVANDYWDNSVNIVTHKVSWINPTGIPNGTRIHVVLMRPDGTHEDCDSRCTSLGYANVEAGEVVISTGAVLRLVPVGSYYVDLRVGYANPLTAPIAGRSGLFEIGSGPRQTSDKFVIGDRVVTIAVVNVRDSANGTVIDTKQVGAHGTVIGGPTDAGGFTWWQIDYDCGDTGWSAEHLLDKYTGSVVDDCDGEPPPPPPPPPPHRSWAPPLYSPPNCVGDQGFDPGCFPPINVSVEPQTKSGLLTVGGLISTLGATIQGVFRLPSGWQTGYVLTATDDNKAEWRPGGGGPGGGISQLNQGTGITLTPNPITTTGTISANFTETQRRITGSCSGQVVVGVDSNGAVICEADDTTGIGPTGVSSVSGQNGITVSPTTGAVVVGLNTSGFSGCGDSTTGKVYWDGSKLVCGTDRGGGIGGDNLGDHTATKNIKLGNYYLSYNGTDNGLRIDEGHRAIFSGGVTIKGNNPAAGKVLTSSDAYGYAAWQTPTAYTADESTLTKNASNQFSIKDGGVTAAKIANQAVKNSKLGFRVVGIGGSSTTYCQDPGGDTTETVCEAPGSYHFCAISRFETINSSTNEISSRGGICEVYVQNSIWKIRVRAGTTSSNDKVRCSALCIPATDS